MGWPGPTTHRQFAAWATWKDAKRLEPGLTEWYLMQVAAEIVKTPSRVWGKEPPGPSLHDMRLSGSKESVGQGGGGGKFLPMGRAPTKEMLELAKQVQVFAALGMDLPQKLQAKLDTQLERERRWAAGEDV